MMYDLQKALIASVGQDIVFYFISLLQRYVCNTILTQLIGNISFVLRYFRELSNIFFLIDFAGIIARSDAVTFSLTDKAPTIQVAYVSHTRKSVHLNYLLSILVLTPLLLYTITLAPLPANERSLDGGKRVPSVISSDVLKMF